MTPTPGPYPILCRGHSGGRLLCEAFIRNHIQMGQVDPERRDTEYFASHNPIIRELILNAYHYPTATETQRQYYQTLMKRGVTDYLNTQIQLHPPTPYGWKLGITLFTLPVLLDTFPTAKVIHLIRDGRDVMLSRLEARFGGHNLTDPLNQLIVFGDAHTDHYEVQPLTPDTIARYRNELEMRHWVTAVTYGLRGRAYPDRYLEIKYEDLCQHPRPQFAKIFDFIQVPFLTTTQDWLTQTVHPTRIGKWQNLPPVQLEKPLQIGEKLLKELGYW